MTHYRKQNARDGVGLSGDGLDVLAWWGYFQRRVSLQVKKFTVSPFPRTMTPRDKPLSAVTDAPLAAHDGIENGMRLGEA